MLNVLRRNLKSLSWILWAVVISFIAAIFLFWGAAFDDWGTAPEGEDQDWAAFVDGRKISTNDLERTLGNLEYGYRQQLQGQFEQLRSALRLPEVALGSLVNRELMLQEARRMGLSASPEEIRAEIVTNPVFQTETGFIGTERYQQALRNNNLRVSEFEQGIADDIVISKWQRLVTSPITVTDEEVRREYRDSAESVTFEYVTAAPGRWPPAEPTEAEARQAFEADPSRYQRPDGRTVSYVLIDRSLAADATVPDEEVRAFYDTNAERFRRPEQRRARHILIEVPEGGEDAAAVARAEGLIARIEAGEDFAELARQSSADEVSAERGGDLGWFDRESMVPEFSEAAFGAEVGRVVGPVRTGFGVHILEVTESRPAGTVPFEEVEGRLRLQLAQPRQREVLDRLARELTGADAAAFETIAASKGYEVNDSGVLFADGEFPGQGALPSLMQAVFATPPGEVGGPVAVADGLVVFRVTSTPSPEQIGFEQVRDAVLEDLRAERVRAAAAAGARRELSGAGGSLRSLASKLGGEVRTAGPVTRGQPVAGLPADPALERAIFDAPVGGDPSVLTAADGTVAVVRVTAKSEANEAEFEQQKEAIRQDLRARREQAFLNAFLHKLRRDSDIRTNDSLIQRLNS